MYHTCLHCQRLLGANEAIEHLPIGRRIAFDGHRGRLWVVCGKCGRWNLVPFESRWEALEECEKAYRTATRRASTDQIALARLREGLDLVRIGEPLRPEFAAWRYSAVLRARHRRYITTTVASTVAGLAAVGGYYYFSVVSGLGGAALVFHAPALWDNYRLRWRTSLTIRDRDGVPRRLSAARLLDSEMQRTEDGYPGLTIPFGWKREIILPGPSARNALPGVLAIINQEGASRKELMGAVDLLETSGGSEGYLAAADRLVPAWRKNGRHPIAHLRDADRLALEMALHEESERRALEGELHLLLDAWREAEELAGIADRLALPAEVEERLAAMKDEARRTP